MQQKRFKQLLFLIALLEAFYLNDCKKARSEELRVVSCPTSIKDGRPALVFTYSDSSWKIWCGEERIFCFRKPLWWLDIDIPNSVEGHKNDSKQQWAFYPEGTTAVTFGYICTSKKSK